MIRCDEVVRDDCGEIIELHCSYDPETLGANPQGRKVKGVIHWVSAVYGIDADVHLYDRLFNNPAPDAAKEGKDYREYLNPDSLRTVTRCIVEPSLKESKPGERFQFEREGYFCVDPQQGCAEGLVFNRIVTLRDSWARIEQQQTD